MKGAACCAVAGCAGLTGSMAALGAERTPMSSRSCTGTGFETIGGDAIRPVPARSLPAPD
jgi:hypothetical protein